MSEAFIKHLREKRANTWEQAKALLDAAAAEKRDLTAEEEVTYQKMATDLDEFDKRANDLMTQREASIATQEAFAKLLDQPDERGHGAEAKSEVAAELRAILGERSKIAGDFTATGAEITRALSSGTATAGGNTVAPGFLAQLITPLRLFSPLYAAGATVLTTTSGESIKVPRLSGFGAAAAATEATQLTGTDPSFDQVSLGAFKYGDYRGISTELLEDTAVDIESLITNLIGENIGYLFGQKLTIGAGTTEPAGIVTAATAGKTGAAAVAGAFTFDDLIDLQESILAPYQPKASWIMGSAAIAAARKIKASGSGDYVWQPSVQVGQPDMLFGKPVYRDPYMEAPAAGKKSVLYGDVSKYWIRIVNSVRVERSEHFLFGSDQTAFRGVLRGDGALTDSGAVKVFTGGAAS